MGGDGQVRNWGGKGKEGGGKVGRKGGGGGGGRARSRGGRREKEKWEGRRSLGELGRRRREV